MQLSRNVLEKISFENVLLDNRNARKRCKVCSKLKIKTPARRQQRRSGVFIVKSEHTSHIFLMFVLSNLNKPMLAGIIYHYILS